MPLPAARAQLLLRPGVMSLDKARSTRGDRAVETGRVWRERVQGWFDIHTGPEPALVRLTMGGFFDTGTIESMRNDLVTAIASLGVPANQHLTLCDITAMNIQAQTIVGAFAELVGSPDIRSRKLAFVTAGTLARLQARRLTDRPDVEFFADAEPALAWLY